MPRLRDDCRRGYAAAVAVGVVLHFSGWAVEVCGVREEYFLPPTQWHEAGGVLKEQVRARGMPKLDGGQGGFRVQVVVVAGEAMAEFVASGLFEACPFLKFAEADLHVPRADLSGLGCKLTQLREGILG